MYRDLSNQEISQIIEENNFKSKALLDAQKVFGQSPPAFMEDSVHQWFDGMYAHLYDLRYDILHENRKLSELLQARQIDSTEVA